MVPGSRHILSLLGEIKINPVGQMQHPKEQSHHPMRVKERGADPGTEVGGKQPATSQDKGPAEHLHPARHEKARRMQGASVKDYPCGRQPGHGSSPGWTFVSSPNL